MMMINSNKCLIHMVNKIQLSCLNKQYRHKLQCWRCHYQENKHHSQLVEQAMLFNRIEDKQIFIQIVNECIEQYQNSQQFKQMLKYKVMEQIIDKRQNLKIMSKVMADQSQQIMNQWMNSMNDKMDGQQYKDVNEIKNSMMDKIEIDNELQHEKKESNASELVRQNRQLEEKVKKLQEEMKDQLKDRKKQVGMLIGNNKDLEGLIRKIKQEHQEQLDIKDSKINQLIKQNQDFKARIKEQYQEMKKQLKNIKKDVRGLNGEGQDIKGLIKKQQCELKQEVKKKYQQLSGLIKQTSDNKTKVVQQSKQYENVVDIKDKVVQQLQQYENVVDVKEYNKIEEYKRQIEEYQQNSKQYKILINFGYLSSFCNIDSKMSVLEMIDTLNANSNVGSVEVGIDNSIEWNDQVVTIMMNRFSNIYDISILDYNNQIDDVIHKITKQWIQQQSITQFQLWFYNGSQLYKNDDGLKLIKEYNQLIKQKQCLGRITYQHNAIGGRKNTYGKQKVEELIKKVEES